MHGYEPPPELPGDYAVPAGFRFVDAHVHLFDHSVPGLSWPFEDPGWEHPRLKGAWRLDQPRFSVPEYRAEAAPLGVDKMVHIQAASLECGPVAETAWLQSLHDRYGWPNAIVGPCDLAAPSAPDTIARQAEFGAFRGVRDAADGAAIGTPAWERGFEALVARGGSCDLMIPVDHFAAALGVARRHPDAVVVIEHAGLPVVSKLDSYFAAWSAGLAELATADNVVCKISALSSAALPNFFTASLRRWADRCLELFGPQRCMFASNWPIDKLFVTYPRLLSAFRQVAADLTPSEQEAMFATTAERVYRI